jgi:hypothetical protein
VSPAVTLSESSTFSFWACAQDAGYAAEHSGVAISDDGVNFGMVQEWTLTAKDGGKAPRGMNAQGNWYQYTVNLGDYAGEGRYIALRHFNCTDMFYIDVDDLELSNGAKNRSDLVAYNVYRATEAVGPYSLIATVPAVDGQTYYEYFDNEVPVGTYYYQVTAVYDDGCESVPAYAYDSAADYVVVNVDAIGENIDGVAIYPNPTNGNVKIEANGMKHITVVSILGQTVYDADINGDEFELNMGQYNTGVYVVRIVTENGISTQRVTVVK